MKQVKTKLFFLMVVAAVSFMFCVSVEAKPLKIHIASWNVPKDPNTKVLKAIAADLEKASNGTVKTELSFKALGKPQDYYDGVEMGICDMAYVGLPYTPGRFPFSEMLGLPIHFPNNQIAAKAHYELWKRGYLDKQFKGVKVICVGTTAPYNFLWSKDEVDTLDGFKGKKIRCPGGPWTKMTEALGGIPVSISPAESYMAIERGTIDGILQTWPAVPVFKLNEVCKTVTEVNVSAFTFAIVMNQNTYDKLPQAAKDVLNQNAEKYSTQMGAVHHGFNQVGIKMMKKANAKILVPKDLEAINLRLKPLFENWVKDMEKKGLPGKKALDELYTILQEAGVKEPFIK